VRVSISVPGKFQPAYLWGRWLETQGRLERLITPLPYRRVAGLGVSRARTTTLAPVGVWNYAVQRFGPVWTRPANQLLVSLVFDALASRMTGRCDVVNGWSSTSLWTLRAARRRGQLAVLQTGSAHIETQAELLADEGRRLGLAPAVTHPAILRRAVAEYELADLIVVPSRFVRDTFVQRGVPILKLAVVAETAMPRTAPPAERPRRSRPRILFVGQVDVRKGIPYLLEAFRALEGRAALRLVGPADRRLLSRLAPLPEGVEAIGPRSGEALAAEFREADVFVLPSVEDGFGLAAVEAMAAGLPVVVSDHAGCADLVDEGHNGFVVPARDARTLAQRLDTLVRDARLRVRMGEAARVSVSSRTWEAYGSEMARAYARLGQASPSGVPSYARAG
jgi:starch synthase